MSDSNTTILDDLRLRWRRFRSSSWRATALDVLLILMAALAISSWQQRDMLETDSEAAAPALQLATIDGQRFDLADALGRTTVVYFFAPWCSVCKASFENLDALRRSRSVSDLTIVAVALDYRDSQEVAAFLADHEADFPVLMGDIATAQAWRIRAYPTYYVLGTDGTVTARSLGYSTELGLRWRS